jgi:N-acetylglucosamine-6-phosphate deacetylase
MKYIVNGRIVLKDRILEGFAVGFDSRIRDVCPETAVPAGAERTDAAGGYVIPGLIDVHIHGYLGADTSDGEPESIRTMAEGLIRNGVTAFLPTSMTIERERIDRSIAAVRAVMDESRTWNGAAVLGMHAEGPFISKAKKGAQNEACIIPPDPDWMIANRDVVRYITVAPEVDPGFAAIRRMSEAGIVVSMGHTNTDFGTAMAAAAAGVRSSTHLFNAMSPIDRRAPGVAAAALTAEVYAELIADTFHVDPGLYPLIARMKGDRLVLITDCLPAGGLAPGTYTLGGARIIVDGIACRLEDGTVAGSILRLNRGVMNFCRRADVPLWQAVRCASLNPAELLRMGDRKGSVEIGKDADLVITDNELEPRRVFVGGAERDLS